MAKKTSKRKRAAVKTRQKVVAAVRDLRRLEAVITDASTTAGERKKARREWARLNVIALHGKSIPALEKIALEYLDNKLASKAAAPREPDP